MNNYYKILEIDKNATEQEVKESYRRLAKKYHPDKSNYKEADRLFATINQAYEVLGDPERRQQYDQITSETTTYSTSQKRHHSTYYSSTSTVDIAPYVKYFQWISYMSLVVSLILCLDYLLPRVRSIEQVVSEQFVVATHRNGRQYIVGTKVVTDKGEYNFGTEMSLRIHRGQEVESRSTMLLRKPTKVLFILNNSSVRYDIEASIFHNFSFMLIALLICSILGSFLKKPDMALLNLGIVNGVLMLLVVYFTFIS